MPVHDEQPSTWTPSEIRELREELGLTQKELAEELGLDTYEGSAPRVSDLEQGRRDASGPIRRLLDQLQQRAAE
jgi:transcriptional regulator with XRE-family HTH domain